MHRRVSAPDRNIAALPGLKLRLDGAGSPFHQGAERVLIRPGSAIASRPHGYKIMQCRAKNIPIASSYRIPENVICERLVPARILGKTFLACQIVKVKKMRRGAAAPARL